MAALESNVDRTHESALSALLAEARASLPGASWLQPLRNEALARVNRDGLPHRRMEAWKYTDLRARLSPDLTLARAGAPALPAPFDGIAGHRIDIANGKVARLPDEDLPDGLEVIGLADALATPALWLRPWLEPAADALQNLNLAFASDGALIRVGRGLRVAQPVVLRTTLGEVGAMANTRSIILLEEGAELTLIEIDDGTPGAQSLANVRTSIGLEPGARLRHLRVCASGNASIVVHNHDIELGRDAAYEGVLLSSGAALARHQMSVRLSGTGSSFDLACAYAAGKDEHNDYTLEIVHEAAHTMSRLLTKGVASANGHGVVQGRVVVQPDAQKTDSHQMSRALLLSSHAEIDQKPELEIFADDVKCGHGAAIGAVDPNQMFYLRARGIPEREARSMLVAAFLGEVTERVPDAYRETVEAWLAARMIAIGGAA